MISELVLMELAGDRQKIQQHDHSRFPCSAYYTRWTKTGITGVPWHWHDELEFAYVARGSAKCIFGEEEAILHEGDGLFVNVTNFHQIEMTDCPLCQVRSIVADPLLLSGGPDTVFQEKYISPVTGVRAFPGAALFAGNSKHRDILEHIKKAHAACETEQDAFEYAVRYHLSMALSGIRFLFQEKLKELEDTSFHSRRTRAILDYIHHHYSEPVTLPDMAASASICEREVQRCFRADLHLSPITYLQNYRIHIARKMLLESRQSVLEIGMACGFQNPSHFCRIFRKHTGSSPMEFRQNNLRPGEIRPGSSPASV